MKLVYLVLNWIFGVILLMTGVLFLIESPFGGICLIAISALLLPLVRNFVYSKTGKELSKKMRAISVLILLVLFLVVISQFQDSKKQELVTQQSQEKPDYFIANRDQIISSVKTALLVKDYKSVISEASKYEVVGDKEIEQMNVQAEKGLEAIQKKEKTEKLLSLLKNLSIKEYEKNYDLYKQLTNLHPYNEKYKSKLSFYEIKIFKAKEKARIALAKLQKEVNSMVGKKVPYKKWKEWGSPETLDGTNNKYWIVYLPAVNVSFVSEKKTDIIIYSGFNKNSAQKFIAQKEKKRKE